MPSRKKIALSLVAAFTLPAMSASNAELEAMLIKLQKDFGTYKVTQEKKIASLEKKLSVSSDNKKSTPKTNKKKTTVAKKEKKQETLVAMDNNDFSSEGANIMPTTSDVVSTDTYESFSDLGLAASKVYNSESALSIGGYGEYRYRKFTNFKNFSSPSANKLRRKSETNVVRFVPYIGYKFNDWIIMNTEIEFEDGGARSDGTKNYKYAIVEFSYLDFLLDEKYNVRAGHVLVPFGNINLNHEPVAFLTSQRPLVESLIIPSTWHTNGILGFGTYEDFDYYAGIITSPDPGNFTEGRFIQQGRRGAKQLTDDVSGVARVSYKGFEGIETGGSLFYGKGTTPHLLLPTSDIDVSMFMAEAHANYKYDGWNVQALAVYGSLGDDYKQLIEHGDISGEVNGQYLTVGYDVLHNRNTSHQLYVVGEVERLDLDADNRTVNPDDYKYNEYTFGFAYFPDPKVVIKADYTWRDYRSGSRLADEESFIAALGFIF
ncbi:MAG: hypothetical protein COB07_04265 [Sulfurovum sp.]|nr:MAG: hypothetical protein COB07_04265 [Sulfurovum sp.]